MEREIITVSTKMTQSNCEELVAALSTRCPDTLELPERLDSLRALGLESSVISLIVTWGRASSKPRLVLPLVGAEAEHYLSKLCQTAYGLTALTMAKIVSTSDGVEISTKKIKELVNKRLLEFDDRNLQILSPDQGISLVSVYSHHREYGKWLYAQPDGAIGVGMLMPDQFGSWLSHLVKQMLPKEFLERLDAERVNSISAATYELLENAFNHGRLNMNAVPIKVGVCGLSIRVIQTSYDEVNALSSGNKDASLYFAQRLLKDKTKEKLFLEITVFDSGIGYHQWINAPCNEGAATQQFRGKGERATVQECILRHATSKRSDGSGVGLYRVLRLLKDLFGFMRIRTGNTCLYARLDLKDDGTPRVLGEQEPHGLGAPPDLRDWFPNRELPQAAGTAVTICIPLTHWSLAK